jgi:hypothetical protein
MTRLRRPLAVWLAVVIALLGALAPTLSRALSVESGEGTVGGVEICTTNGSRWMPLDASDASTNNPSTTLPAGQKPSLSLDHCPFCLLGPDRAGPVPQVVSIDFSHVASHRPLHQQARPFASVHHRHALARGPPVFNSPYILA